VIKTAAEPSGRAENDELASEAMLSIGDAILKQAPDEENVVLTSYMDISTSVRKEYVPPARWPKIRPGASMAGSSYCQHALRLRSKLRHVRASEKRHGPNHFKVAQALHELASHYADQGNHHAEQEVLRRVLEIQSEHTCQVHQGSLEAEAQDAMVKEVLGESSAEDSDSSSESSSSSESDSLPLSMGRGMPEEAVASQLPSYSTIPADPTATRGTELGAAEVKVPQTSEPPPTMELWDSLLADIAPVGVDDTRRGFRGPVMQTADGTCDSKIPSKSASLASGGSWV
jgi:hypothetical protein